MLSKLFRRAVEMVEPDRINPYSDVSWTTYSLEDFAFSTAPIIAVIAVTAYISGRLLGKGSGAQERVRSGVIYLSGYILLLSSVIPFGVTLGSVEVLKTIAVPGPV